MPQLLALPRHSDLLDQFKINVPGQDWRGEVYRTQHRATGRRILVREGAEVLFDTGDQYDLGNARNGLENWLAEMLAVIEEPKGGEGGAE